MNQIAKTEFPTARQIETALDAIAKIGGVTDIFYVACGGSFANMLPNQHIIDRLGKNISAQALNSAEFKARNPARLGEKSVVILCSFSGKTPETAAAAQFARSSGALTIAITNGVGSPLDEAAELSIYHNFDPVTFEMDHAMAVLAQLTFGILDRIDDGAIGAQAIKEMEKMPVLVDAAVKAHKSRIEDFAKAHSREKVIYTMASGANYGVAYTFAICIFQEMQWIHSAAIHSNEYFHGPFEVTDFDVPFIVLRSLGTTKEVDDRAIRFMKQHSDMVTVLDSQELGLDAISSDVVEFLEPFMFGALLRNYCERLAFERGHPLTVRRYMWQIEY